MKISCLGPKGSFSDIAAEDITKLFEKSLDLDVRYCKDFYEVFSEFCSERADCALLPIENSLGGSVPEVLDMFWNSKVNFKVALEWVLSIEHNLFSFGKLSDIREIRAHEQAFLQCRDVLKNILPNCLITKMSSNSAAIESLLRLNNDKEKLSIAAIGPRRAAEIYQIPILKEKINDLEDNYTRFWLISKPEMSEMLIEKLKEKQKRENRKLQNLCSFAFKIPVDRPGGLVSILFPLAQKGINMTKIESRTARKKLCEYTFFVDVANAENKDILELRNLCSEFRMFGAYPVFPLEDYRF